MYSQPYLRSPVESLLPLFLGALNYVCQCTGAPLEIVLADIFAVSATVTQRGYKVRGIGGNPMPLSLNTLSIAPTACGKGESFRTIFQDPTIDDLLLQEVSPSALMADLDGIGKSASIQMEDAYSFLRSGLMKSDYISELPRACSGPPSMKRGRHNNQKTAIEPCLSIGLRIQPDVLYPELKRDKGKNCALGFWPRFLVFNHDPQRFPTLPWQPVSADILDFHALMDRLHALLPAANSQDQLEKPARKVLVMDTEAHARLRHIDHWVKVQMQGQFHDIQDAAGRAVENTLRLAANFQVVCHGECSISCEMIDRAWTFVQWSLEQYRQVFILAAQPPPQAVKPKVPKTPKLPRHQKRIQEDMQFMVDCIAACSYPSPNQWVRQQDVAYRTGFSQERFLKTLLWLIAGGYVEVTGDEAHGMIRLLPIQPSYVAYG